MGNTASEEKLNVQDIIKEELREEVNDNIISLFDYLTSELNYEQLIELKNMSNFDFIPNYWAMKANSNKDVINAIIDRKLKKEEQRIKKEEQRIKKEEQRLFGKRRRSKTRK